MKRRTLAQIGIQLAPFLLLFPGLPFPVQAGSVKIWWLKETASAPVLVVGRVIAVHKNERVPENRLSWKAETWSITADIEVLRSYTASGELLALNRLQVDFLAYGPSVTMFINMYPPPSSSSPRVAAAKPYLI